MLNIRCAVRFEIWRVEPFANQTVEEFELSPSVFPVVHPLSPNKSMALWRLISVVSLLLLLLSLVLQATPEEQQTSLPQRVQKDVQTFGPLSPHDEHGDHHHHHDSNNHDKDEPFCHGMSMSMFMDGFRWSLRPDLSAYAHHSDDKPTNSTDSSLPQCLSYYVQSWKLDMSGKFRGAMVFSFLLALLTEGLSRARVVLIKYIHLKHGRHRKLVLTVIYALQQWLGTLIMLVSMMYSIEMLLSVVAGLTVGNFLFLRDHSDETSSSAGSSLLPAQHSASAHPVTGGRRATSDAGNERQGMLEVAAGCCSDDNGSTRGLQMQACKDD